ncbi:MAG: tetratricopeptide repeat protein [Planctomycetes bacterium]|nr:tetratricopeptide repeat protein [Planctomycetota bacterium]
MGAADNFFAKADQALKRKNFDYAIELLLQGLAVEPLRLEERKKLRQAELAKILAEGGNPKGGFGTKVKTAATRLKIQQYGMKKDWERQILEIENCLKYAPHEIGLLFSLAHALRQIPNGEESATQVLQEIVEIDRAQVEAWRQLGNLFAAKDPEKAIQCWEKVRQYKPEDKEAGKAIRDLSAATMVRKAEERKASGEGSYRDLLKDEEEAAKLEMQAHLLRTDEDRLKRIEHLIEQVKEKPKDLRLIRQIGELYAQNRDYDASETWFRKAIEIDPQDTVSAEKIGDLKVLRLREQLEELEKQAEESPDDVEVAEKLKSSRRTMTEYLIEELTKRVKDHPTDQGLKLQLGQELMKAERHKEAIENFQKAVTDPKLAVRAHALMGSCFYSMDLFPLAVSQLQAAREGVADPTSEFAKEVRYDLGMAYAAQGNHTRARELMEEIMAIDIGFRDVANKVVEFAQKERESGQS